MKATGLALGLLLAFSLSAFAAPPTVSISFSATAVVVTDVPPGHDILVFGIAKEPSQYFTTQVQRERILSPAPGEHSVTWDIGKTIARRSVWCAVDLRTGDFDVKAPPSGVLSRMTDGPSFLRDESGGLASIVHQRADAVVLLVTPGRGVWRLRSGDGDSIDQDPAVARTRMPFTRFVSSDKNGPPPPKKLTSNDVIIVIDPLYLDVWSGKIGQEVQP